MVMLGLIVQTVSCVYFIKYPEITSIRLDFFYYLLFSINVFFEIWIMKIVLAFLKILTRLDAVNNDSLISGWSPYIVQNTRVAFIY